MSFDRKAYLGAMQVFVEAVVTNGQTLKAAIATAAAWHHLWTVYAGEDSGSGPSRAAAALPDASADLRAELRRFEQRAKDLKQAKQDQEEKYESEPRDLRKQLKGNGSSGSKGHDKGKHGGKDKQHKDGDRGYGKRARW